jgi:hypothetical protein
MVPMNMPFKVFRKSRPSLAATRFSTLAFRDLAALSVKVKATIAAGGTCPVTYAQSDRREDDFDHFGVG